MPISARSHTCGELSSKFLTKKVRLCGWVSTRRDHGGLIFVDLRDRYGLTQVVFDPAGGDSDKKAHMLAESLRSEFVISIQGTVRHRPKGMANEKMGTGEIEVLSHDLEILSQAKTPPFMIEDSEVTETLRLKYRYLDLRRPALQKNFITRHRVTQIIRQVLDRHHFLEIETPILYKSTPEGARDFIVPSRLNPGQFYALPQSPQTLKQLLMVAGFDRYYQVARCFRDEDLRAERQPEFSQIDLEASFIDQEFIFSILEEMMAEIWKEIHHVEIKLPFERLAYKDAINQYGSDKPDTRFDLKLQDISKIFQNSDFQVFKKALAKTKDGLTGAVRCIHVPGQAKNISRKDLDGLTKIASEFGAKGLLWIKVQAGNELQSPAAKFFSDQEKKELIHKLNLNEGDLILSVADPLNKIVCHSLGAIRLEIGKKLKLIPKEGDGPLNFLWVDQFPLLEFDEKEGRYYAAHHPFTSPDLEDKELLRSQKNLGSIRAAAYDLVLNGVEIGGGSLRIFESDLQNSMFKALGISEKEAKDKFGFFIEALQYGTPPHGGIALGLDRLVALVCGVGPIRDVMAYPKTQKGQCLMSQTPSTVNPEQLAELGISVSKRS